MAAILTESEAARELAPVVVPRGTSAREVLDYAKPLADRGLAGDPVALIQLARLIQERGEGAC